MDQSQLQKTIYIHHKNHDQTHKTETSSTQNKNGK